MTKEELRELMQEDRPNQKILEVIDFRKSDTGIEGELYLATVKLRTIRATIDGIEDYTTIVDDMPYPLSPAKAIQEAKIQEMLKKSEEGFKNALMFLDEQIESEKKDKKNTNQ